MSARCPHHPTAELVRATGQTAPVTCPGCGARYCLDCGKRAPEAWSSGACHACYRKRMAAQRQREHDDYMESLARAWGEGHETDEHGRGNCACPNPYRQEVTP